MSDVFTAENEGVLQERGITHIVSVSAGISPRYPSRYTYHVIKIDDSPTQNIS